MRRNPEFPRFSRYSAPMPLEEEIRLTLAWQKTSDREAADRLLQQYDVMIFKVTRKLFHSVSDKEALIQEARLGFLKGLLKFNTERGAKPSTYAIWWARAGAQEFAFQFGGRTGALGISLGRSSRSLRLTAYHRQQLARGEAPGTYREACAAIGIDPSGSAENTWAILNRVKDIELDKAIGEKTHERVGDTINLADTVDQPDLERVAEVRNALVVLDEREREIVERRYLADDPETLKEVGDAWGLSRERVRQLEARALRQLARAIRLARAGFPPRAPTIRQRQPARGGQRRARRGAARDPQDRSAA